MGSATKKRKKTKKKNIIIAEYLEMLSYAIKKIKKNMAMDPDKDFAELFQILDQSNRE